VISESVSLARQILGRVTGQLRTELDFIRFPDWRAFHLNSLGEEACLKLRTAMRWLESLGMVENLDRPAGRITLARRVQMSIPPQCEPASTLSRLNEIVSIPGDIILTTTTAAISKTIRIATQSDISHAMVYVENRSVIDATGEGVHGCNTKRLFFEDDCSIHALRLRASIYPSQLSEVVSYMRGQVGTQYSAKEAVLTVLGPARTWTKKQFRSRFVAQAFASAGIALVPDPNYCSPADIKDSPLLVSLESPTAMVSASEAALRNIQCTRLHHKAATCS
jgi:hypothetical protein